MEQLRCCCAPWVNRLHFLLVGLGRSRVHLQIKALLETRSKHLPSFAAIVVEKRLGFSGSGHVMRVFLGRGMASRRSGGRDGISSVEVWYQNV